MKRKGISCVTFPAFLSYSLNVFFLPSSLDILICESCFLPSSSYFFFRPSSSFFLLRPSLILLFLLHYHNLLSSLPLLFPLLHVLFSPSADLFLHSLSLFLFPSRLSHSLPYLSSLTPSLLHQAVVSLHFPYFSLFSFSIPLPTLHLSQPYSPSVSTLILFSSYLSSFRFIILCSFFFLSLFPLFGFFSVNTSRFFFLLIFLACSFHFCFSLFFHL